MSVSVAAQIGTGSACHVLFLPLFSVHFLLTNLVVIPFITIILYAAVIMLLLTPLSWLQDRSGTEGVKNYWKDLISFVRWVEQLSLRFYRWNLALSVGNIGYLYRWFFVNLFFMNRRLPEFIDLSFYYLITRVFIMQHYMVWIDRPRTSIVFYNVRGCPAVHCMYRQWMEFLDSLWR